MSNQLEFGLNWEGLNLNYVEPRKGRVIVSPDETAMGGTKQLQGSIKTANDLGLCRRCKLGNVRLVHFSENAIKNHFSVTGRLVESEPRCDYCY